MGERKAVGRMMRRRKGKDAWCWWYIKRPVLPSDRWHSKVPFPAAFRLGDVTFLAQKSVFVLTKHVDGRRSFRNTFQDNTAFGDSFKVITLFCAKHWNVFPLAKGWIRNLVFGTSLVFGPYIKPYVHDPGRKKKAQIDNFLISVLYVIDVPISVVSVKSCVV